MSRQSSDIPVELFPGVKITIGDQEVIVTCKIGENSDKLPVKEIYVSKATGKLVIIFDDGE